jgi:ABC-2 type transport system ATP-binding protein
MAQTAEHLVVIGRGRMIADTTVAEIVAQASHDAAVLVRTPQASELRELLVGEGVSVTSTERELLEVHGLTSAQVGTTAAEHRIVLHELISQRASLEDAFMRLTGAAVEYHAGTLEPDVIDQIQEAA